MSTIVTREAPDFTAEAVYPNGDIKPFTLSSLRGKYVVLFFYPLDFTFVCPSEILAFNKRIEDFKSRNCEVVGVSIDSAYSHYAWRGKAPDDGGIGEIKFPLVSDITKQVTRSFGILFNESIALRGLFLIDKEGIVRHSVVNDLPFGRNVFEALRMLHALQFFEKHGEVCPANWNPGDDAMKASPQGVADYLAKHKN